ncbi:MAG: hypothetical protein ACETWE_12550 [Candidatus Bathyarchaeia archaeon]
MYLPAMIPAQKLLYGEQRNARYSMYLTMQEKTWIWKDGLSLLNNQKKKRMKKLGFNVSKVKL